MFDSVRKGSFDNIGGMSSVETGKSCSIEIYSKNRLRRVYLISQEQYIEYGQEGHNRCSGRAHLRTEKGLSSNRQEGVSIQMERE